MAISRRIGFINIISGLVATAALTLPLATSGAQAAELIVPWSLSVQKRMNVKEMAGLIAPSQSLSELSQKAALSFQAPLAASPGLRRLIGFLRRFG